MQNFRMLEAPPPDPQNSPQLRISGYAPDLNSTLQSDQNFRSSRQAAIQEIAIATYLKIRH